MQQLKKLRERRDQHIVNFTTEYKIKGYEVPPFREDDVKRLLKHAEELLTRAHTKFRQNKVNILSH
jgi:hypothetical protein